MIKLTLRHAKQTGTANQIHASIEDVHKLTFEDESFDLIIALGVFHWLYDLRKAIREIVRTLRPGGYVLLSIPHSHAFLNPLSLPAFESFLNGLSRNDFYSHTYLPKEFNQYLLVANLTIIRSTNVGFGPIKLLDRWFFLGFN